MRNLRDRHLLLLAMALVLVGQSPRRTAAQLLGSEFQVNDLAPGFHRQPAVTADDAGDFVVVWQSYQDGSAGGVSGQRFDSGGNKVAAEFQVNSWTTGQQWDPSVAADDAGNFLVVWTDDNAHDLWDAGVFGQRYSSTGSPVGGEFQVNTYWQHGQNAPAVAMDGSGNALVVWVSGRNPFTVDSYVAIYGQLYDAAGSAVGPEFQVSGGTSTRWDVTPAVAVDGSGDFVVVWRADPKPDPQPSEVFGQRIDATGGKIGSEFQVNSYTTGNQMEPAVTADGSGAFVVVWMDDGQGNYAEVFGQRYDAQGVRSGSEFLVNTFTSFNQEEPAVTVDGLGNFVVTWSSLFQIGSGWDVFGQRFDSAGGRVGKEFQVNTYTSVDQRLPAVAADGSGNFVVVWERDGLAGHECESGCIFGQCYAGTIFGGAQAGFEDGTICGWDLAVGSADNCP